ncbi:MAG: VWA domain-containing protein [Clostridiales bacterium]|nr:VWA domain-containing protein [Clostridiales bacterium]
MNIREMGRSARTAKRPLDIFYVIDTSGSMYGTKIQSVNNAMSELNYMLKEEARKNPQAQVNVRVMTFGDGTAKWHTDRTAIEDFQYQDINDVNGSTPLGMALNNLCMALDTSKMPTRGFKPIIVLLSDGMPNDTWEPNLEKLLNLPWGKHATKIAIAIKPDADVKMLEKFTTDRQLVLEANSTADIRYFLKWTSTMVSQNSRNAGDEQGYTAFNIPRSAPNTMLRPEDDIFVK